MHETHSAPTVQCYVRASVAAAPVDEAIETLRTHEETGRIKRLLVEVWPDTVRVPEPASHDRVVDVHRLFAAWADRQGVALAPAFVRRTCTSEFTGTTWEEVTTPVICMAVYREGQLVGVYPHTDDGDVLTVGAALAHLEAGTLPTRVARDRAPPIESRAGACPACLGGLINGQGLYLCPDCEWTGTATTSGTYQRDEQSAREQGIPQ